MTGELNERTRRLVAARNQTGDGLSLSQAVEASRDEYVVERTFGRVIGHPLSLSPLDVEQDDHATGLVAVVVDRLAGLDAASGVARRQLAQEGAALAGLSAGNPKRATTHPTTERLLEAFQEMTLTLVIAPHQTRRHLTALPALKACLLPTFYKVIEWRDENARDPGPASSGPKAPLDRRSCKTCAERDEP